MNNGKDVVDRIDTLLKNRNQKRQALADYAGISVQAFTNWSSRGNFPPSDIALKMAEFLNISIEYLITGEKPDFLEKIKETKELLLKVIENLDTIR